MYNLSFSGIQEGVGGGWEDRWRRYSIRRGEWKGFSKYLQNGKWKNKEKVKNNENCIHLCDKHTHTNMIGKKCCRIN